MLSPPGGARPVPGVSPGRPKGGVGCHAARCRAEDAHAPTPADVTPGRQPGAASGELAHITQSTWGPCGEEIIVKCGLR